MVLAYRSASNGPTVNKAIKRKRDLEEIPWPAWELFPLEEYMENKFSYGVDRGRSLPVMAT
jgi:hypothetical protein